MIKLCVGKNTRNCVQYFLTFLTVVLFTYCTCCILICPVCIAVVAVCVLLSRYVCLLYYVCTAAFTLDARLLAIKSVFERSCNGHLYTGFSWFPCFYKQMLRSFPTFQVATTCFSCSPPYLKLLVTNFILREHVK